ncbi:MAG: 3-dehydroquinate synthase, partial [Alphaproteobacteria bacterium]|nr:3-dehydroquinate synthase [Alphaproteobacteria bacterium]
KTKVEISDAFDFNIDVKKDSRFFIITDSNVANLYLQEVLAKVSSKGQAEFIIIDASEKSKSWETIGKIIDEIISFDPKRSDYIIGLGGGVITDIVGFVASIINRGTRLILIPTTLLSMIDSAIGGKNGINYNNFKNKIGTIYPANNVIIATSMLKSLTEAQILEGVCEAIKIAICRDINFCKFLQNKKYDILNLDFKLIRKLITKAIKLKNQVVGKDLLDSNQRMILNFGHTIGHAIESYEENKIPHGIAVGMGMYIETDLLHKLGLSSKKTSSAIKSLLEAYDVPEYLGNLDNIIEIAVKSDKKRAENNTINLVVPNKLGEALIKKIDVSKIKNVSFES